jgi:hypothetical protein
VEQWASHLTTGSRRTARGARCLTPRSVLRASSAHSHVCFVHLHFRKGRGIRILKRLLFVRASIEEFRKILASTGMKPGWRLPSPSKTSLPNQPLQRTRDGEAP